jgi:hypothetical protein
MEFVMNPYNLSSHLQKPINFFRHHIHILIFVLGVKSQKYMQLTESSQKVAMLILIIDIFLIFIWEFETILWKTNVNRGLIKLLSMNLSDKAIVSMILSMEVWIQHIFR